jgi:hypothetical protein
MLQSEWNADDSDAKQHPECQMREADPDSTYKYPDDIHQHTETSTITGTTAYFPPKRTKSQHRQLQSLETERNADDSNHQQQAGNNIFHADQKSTANQPNNIEQ